MSKYSVEITGINTNELISISQEDMTLLFKDFKNGNMEAKNKLILSNLKLVLSILRKYSNNKYNLDDLFQVGVIGLIKAINNFDLEYGTTFSTYSVPLIEGEIKRHIRDNTPIRISRGIKDTAYRVLKFREDYENTYGVAPNKDIVCKSLNINEYEMRLALDSLNDVSSIFEAIYNDGGDTIYLYEQISDKKIDNNKDDLISLKKSLIKLKQRERKILEDRYIIGKTQSEIASELNISQAQVSRIEKGAIKALKRYLK